MDIAEECKVIFYSVGCCDCPVREMPPKEIPEPPCEFMEENVPKLKEFSFGLVLEFHGPRYSVIAVRFGLVRFGLVLIWFQFIGSF